MKPRSNRIFLVDDDRTVTRTVGLFLESRGCFEVLVENDSKAALQKARAFRPDLILLDVDMPGLDGGDVASLLKGDDDLRDVPIIFMSSLITEADRGGNGEHRYLPKPSKPAELLACIDSVLNHGRELHHA